MSIEDEIRERIWPMKVDYLDEKEAKDIVKLIPKARSAPRRSTARWYLSLAESLVEKARKKVEEFSFVNPYKTSQA